MTRLSLAGAALAAAMLVVSPAVAQDPAPPAQAEAQATYTDAQLRAFAEASADVEPLTEQFRAAPEAARAPIGAQIVSTLQTHGLTLEAYNGIVAAAQADPALAQRIATLRAEAQTESAG